MTLLVNACGRPPRASAGKAMSSPRLPRRSSSISSWPSHGSTPARPPPLPEGVPPRLRLPDCAGDRAESRRTWPRSSVCGRPSERTSSASPTEWPGPTPAWRSCRRRRVAPAPGPGPGPELASGSAGARRDVGRRAGHGVARHRHGGAGPRPGRGHGPCVAAGPAVAAGRPVREPRLRGPPRRGPGRPRRSSGPDRAARGDRAALPAERRRRPGRRARLRQRRPRHRPGAPGPAGPGTPCRRPGECRGRRSPGAPGPRRRLGRGPGWSRPRRWSPRRCSWPSPTGRASRAPRPWRRRG